MSEEPNRKITVEDLLRVKRAERPAAEFWGRFESEIRAKQLSAIVGPRPWWSRLPAIVPAARRLQAPLAALAAVALAFSAYRFAEMGPVAVAAPARPAAPSLPSRAASAAVAVSVVHASPAPSAAREERAAAVVGAGESAQAPRPVLVASAPHQSPAPAAALQESIRSPFDDGIAVTLADFRDPGAEAAHATFADDREFEPSIAPARQPAADPLARMDPAAERRARLLSGWIPSPESRQLAGDWMRRRDASDDRMYESMDREASDDRALVGFRF